MAADSVVVRSEEAPADAPVEAGTIDTQAQDRPQWLPEKFKSPEELAKAYESLQQKLGSSNDSETKQESDEQEAPAQDEVQQQAMSAWDTKFTDFSREYGEQGKLSDQSYTKLTEMGYPREVVDAYIEGQRAIAEKSTSSLLTEIGGQESFTAMRDWAAQNVPKPELKAYNDMLEGSAEQASIAVKGMYARFQAANGGNFKAPKLLSGTQTKGSLAPYRSTAELTRAMSNPKYKQDPAYRKEVEQRLSVSSIL
jgi:hypothetical protein